MKEELTIYQANRREVVFDVTHRAFSAAFETLLGRTDVGAFADVAPLVRDHDAVWPARHRRRRTFAGRQRPAIASRDHQRTSIEI